MRNYQVDVGYATKEVRAENPLKAAFKAFENIFNYNHLSGANLTETVAGHFTLILSSEIMTAVIYVKEI